MYFDETLDKLSYSDKPIYIIIIMSDFNIDLLKSESRDYSHNFLLSLQSYSFFPVLDKPTGVYDNSATLTDTIPVNRFDLNANYQVATLSQILATIILNFVSSIPYTKISSPTV